jgi:hypothetical protein
MKGSIFIAALLLAVSCQVEEATLELDNSFDDYVSASLSTLAAIQTLTNTLQLENNITNSSSSVISVLQNTIYPLFPVISSPGFAYMQFGKSSKVYSSSSLVTSIYRRIQTLNADYY